MTSLKDSFICKICQKIRKEPIFLPCNCSSICFEHVESSFLKDKTRINSIICEECHKSFEILTLEKYGFKENKLMKNLIENEDYLTQEEKELKRIAEIKLRECEDSAKKLKTQINEFFLIQYDYFANIKNEIDIKRETLIQNLHQANCDDINSVNYILDEVNASCAEMISRVERTEQGFRKNFEKIKPKLIEGIDLLNMENLRFVEFFRDPTLTSSSITSLISEYENNQVKFEKRIKNFKLYEYDLSKNKFKPCNNISTDFRSIGHLELCENFFDICDDEIQNVFVTHWNEKDIHIFNLNTNVIVKSLCGHTDGIWCLILYDDSNKLITGSEDASIKIWGNNQISEFECLETLHGHTGEVYCLKLLNSGRLASGANDSTIIIWDLQSLTCLFILKKHSSYVTCLEEVINGYIVSGSSDLTLRMWYFDEIEYKCITANNAHARNVRCLKALPNGYLASSSDDCLIKIWFLNYSESKIECVKSLKGHTGSIYNLELTISDQFLISCSFDSTIRVWDWVQGHFVRKLDGHGESAYCIKLNKTRGELLSAYNDDVIKIWNLNTGECVRTIKANFSIWNLELCVKYI